MGCVEPIRNKNDLKKIENVFKKNYRDYVMFKIGINWGLRISDILALNVEDVKNKTYLQITEKKTKKKRKILINNKLKSILAKYTKNRANNEPLFRSKYAKNRLERVAAYRIIKSACKRAGIEENIGTHTLRKTFGYHYYKKFKDIVMLQKIFNHSSPSITLRYIGIEEDKILNSYSNFAL